MKNLENDMPGVIKKLSRCLGVRESFFPSEVSPGFMSIYKLKKGIEIKPAGDPVTPGSLGKIWSNQGLYPAVKNIYESIFRDSPFEFFAGFSMTSHFEYVYYINARDPLCKVYFRGETEFFGESRVEEVKKSFQIVQDLKKRMKTENNNPLELVFHVREMVIRRWNGEKYTIEPLDLNR